ncbi:hypothetical protein ACS0TY_024102 [Phlomoides rotata]
MGWNRGGGRVNRGGGGVAGDGGRRRALGAAAGRGLLEEGAMRLVPHQLTVSPAGVSHRRRHKKQFRNGGQTRVCANRILVQEGTVFDKS